MQTLKGLGALLLTAAVIFAVFGINNLASQKKYAVKSVAITLANAVNAENPAATEAKIRAGNEVKTGAVKTNIIARQKAGKANL